MIIDRLDGASTRTAIKGPCVVATTAAISLSGEQTIDGIAVVTGDRVLVKNQMSGADNGIYVVDTGPWGRAKDFNKNNDIVQGTAVYVNNGAENAGTFWVVSTEAPFEIGVTVLVFTRYALTTSQISFEFSTRAAFALALIPSTQAYVRTAGYTSAGDGGGALYARVSSEPSHQGKVQSADGAWWELAEGSVTVAMFGGVRDYTTNSRTALVNAIAFAQAKRVPIRDWGVYGIVGSIEITGDPVNIEGLPGPAHMWFSITDHGVYLRDGFKAQLPGLCFVFKSGGTITTQSLSNRSDGYATVAPCITVSSAYNSFRRVTIVQDMNLYDGSGSLNNIAAVNASMASGYDTGLFIKDTRDNLFEDLAVFGYFTKAGVAVWSLLGSDDPDYNTFIGGTFYGRHGVAILAAQGAAVSNGLSGTRFIGCNIGAKDPKARLATDTTAAWYADAETWRCVYIDGDTTASANEINGHFFTNCVIRTSADHLIELDHASNVKFIGCLFEYSGYGVTGSSGTPSFIGSANVKKGVEFIGCRMNQPAMVFNADFAGAITGNAGIIITGDPLDGGVGVVSGDPLVAGAYGLVRLGADGGTGDPAIQMTDNALSQTAGWVLRRDLSTSDTLKILWDNSLRWSLTTDGVAEASAGTVLARYTATEIASAASAANTTGKTVGLMVFDTTNTRIMVANGSATTSTWKSADGATTVTPS